MSGLAVLSAGLMLATALTHSILGERRLIRPLLAMDAGILQRPLARQVIRFAWHVTSLLMLASAATLLWPDVPAGLRMAIAICWLSAGLIDLFYTSGKHVGWPLITAAGAAALVA